MHLQKSSEAIIKFLINFRMQFDIANLRNKAKLRVSDTVKINLGNLLGICFLNACAEFIQQ